MAYNVLSTNLFLESHCTILQISAPTQSNTTELAHQGVQGYLIITGSLLEQGWNWSLQDSKFPEAGLEIPV